MCNEKNYNDDIYKMYEEQYNKAITLTRENKHLKLDYDVLYTDYSNLKNNFGKKANELVEKTTKPLIEQVSNLSTELDKAREEISRLKTELSKKNYNVDKLECIVNKDSTNSGIPTSKEIVPKHTKTGANTYNHREKSEAKPGGQFGHKGRTLTKEKLQKKMKDNNIKTKKIVHYINGNEKDIIKYVVRMPADIVIEEHIFKHKPSAKEKLPKKFYSDVTYGDDLKATIVTLGNYYSLGYNKVKEILYDFSNGIIDISEGTVDNIYEEFSNKSLDTISNITTNLLNGTYQHTDETTTKENGKDSYYRGYANKENVLYKYHDHKGDAPIKEDDILPNFHGTVISDHEVGIFKYGINNQDCIYHIGRYCIEGNQNIYETAWQMKLYGFLLRCNRTRKIAKLYGMEAFEKSDLDKLEKEYDEILENGRLENNDIASTYWKEKENTLLKRLIKYKDCILFYLHDFSIPCDNNFMERALRMIKGKTKVSGGFRSSRGGERFGYIMSVIKTAKLRKMNPLNCIKEIYQGKSLFA